MSKLGDDKFCILSLDGGGAKGFSTLGVLLEVEAIVFETNTCRRIVNYPRQHSENLTTKHQATQCRFKPTVRVFKSMRNKMISDRYLAKGLAPSYFIEGLLSNAPNICFSQRFQDTYDRSMAYLKAATRDQLECANGIHYLVRDYSDVAWSNADFTSYMNAVDAYWKAN